MFAPVDEWLPPVMADDRPRPDTPTELGDSAMPSQDPDHDDEQRREAARRAAAAVDAGDADTDAGAEARE